MVDLCINFNNNGDAFIRPINHYPLRCEDISQCHRHAWQTYPLESSCMARSPWSLPWAGPFPSQASVSLSAGKEFWSGWPCSDYPGFRARTTKTVHGETSCLCCLFISCCPDACLSHYVSPLPEMPTRVPFCLENEAPTLYRALETLLGPVAKSPLSLILTQCLGESPRHSRCSNRDVLCLPA